MYTNLNYIKRGKNYKKRVLDSFRYITQEDKDVEEKPTLFDNKNPLTEELVREMFDEAPENTYFWRFKVSPDVINENKDLKLDLWKLTRDIVKFLEKRLGREEISFVGAEHKNTRNPHVHAILLIQRHGREIIIDRDTIEAVQEFATVRALQQQTSRQQARPLTPVRSVGQERRIQPSTGTLGGRAKCERGGITRPAYLGPPCPRCAGEQPMWKDGSGYRFCPECGFRYAKLSLSRGLEASR